MKSKSALLIRASISFPPSLYKILEEIAKEKPLFFGTLKIDINFREGEFETVAVGRRQTFKN